MTTNPKDHSGRVYMMKQSVAKFLPSIGCSVLLFSAVIQAHAEGVIIERPFEQRTAPSDNNGSSTVDPFWSMREQLQQLQQEIQALRGLSEELSHRLELMERQQKDRYTDLDQRLNDFTAGKNNTGVGAGKSAVSSSEGVMNQQDFYHEKQRYQAAQELVKARKLIEAQKVLLQFLKDFPKGPFSANAHYWLGEVNMVLPKPDLEQAQYHFSYVVKNYTDHPKVPASLYKLGTIYDEKGETQKAADLFNRVIKQYPASTAAQLAKRYLAN